MYSGSHNFSRPLQKTELSHFHISHLHDLGLVGKTLTRKKNKKKLKFTAVPPSCATRCRQIWPSGQTIIMASHVNVKNRYN